MSESSRNPFPSPPSITSHPHSLPLTLTSAFPLPLTLPHIKPAVAAAAIRDGSALHFVIPPPISSQPHSLSLTLISPFSLSLTLPHIYHLQWLLPPYVTEVLFILCVVGVIAFGYFCGDIMDPERNPWTAGFQIVCDVLPV